MYRLLLYSYLNYGSEKQSGNVPIFLYQKVIDEYNDFKEKEKTIKV